MPKVENNQTNKDLCSCSSCPSYTDCSKEKAELLFCATGKSDCKYETNGCVCGSCPVHKANGLEAGYYCIHGSAEEVGK